MRCWGETIRSDDGVFAPKAPARIRIGRSLGFRRFRIGDGAACGGYRAVDRQFGRARAGCPCRFRCGVACHCALGGGRGLLTDVIECDARDSGQTYDHECRTNLTNVPPQEATLGVERIRTGGARRPGKAAPRPSATRMTRWPFAVLGRAVLLLAALTFHYPSPAARFLVVQAETAGLKLLADGQPMSAWHLSDVTVCLWRKDDFQRAGSAPRDCAGKQFAIIALGSLDFSWLSGTGHIFRG